MFSQGSGSVYALGVIHGEYKPTMNIEEAIMLGKKAVMHATHRDGYSGGNIQVYVVRAPDADGHCWDHRSREDCQMLYEEAAKEGVPCFQGLV